MGDWNHPATSATETTAVTAMGTVSGHMTVGRRTGQGGSKLVIIVTLSGQGLNGVGQNGLLLLHYWGKDGTGWDEIGYYYYTMGPRT